MYKPETSIALANIKRPKDARGLAAALLQHIAALVGASGATAALVRPRVGLGSLPPATAEQDGPLHKLTALSLRHCARAPEEFHDLAAVVGTADPEQLAYLAESLRGGRFVELYVKRGKPFIKISRRGWLYLKSLEKVH